MINLLTTSKKAVLFSILFIATCTISAQKRKEIKPKKFVGTVHMIGSTDFIYYALSEKTKTSIEVTGPGVLTLYNRVRLENNTKLSTPYYLKYTLDKKRIVSRKIGPQAISIKVKYKSKKLKGKPSKADKEIIKIPPGKHTISFYKYKTKQKAHIRFMYEQKEKLNWNELKSDNDLKKVTLQYLKTKKEQQYYRVDNANGFSFVTTKGHSKIRVFLRADFDYKMHSENIIRILLREKGTKTTTYKMTCFKSKKVENRTDKKLIPGKLEKLYIDIPVKGNHSYELLLKDPKKSALVRVFLDKKKTTPIKIATK